MVVEGNADDSDTTLQQAYDHIQGIADQGGNLDWDYLSSQFGLGRPPGAPPALTSWKPKDVTLDWKRKRLDVAINSPLGVDGVLLIYRGPFQNDPPADGAGWRFYFGVKVATAYAFAEFPIVGPIDDGAIALRGIQMLLTSHDMTADECNWIYRALRNIDPAQDIGPTDYDAIPTPPLAGITSRVTFKADVQLYTANYPLVVDIGPEDAAPSAGQTDPSDDQAGKPTNPAASATVNKQLGPISINKIQGIYDVKALEFGLCFDASLGLDIFRLTFVQLSLALIIAGGLEGIEFKPAVPELKGAVLSGGVPDFMQITGGLYVQHNSPLDMWGEISIGLPEAAGFTGMGGYATVDDLASVFLFGFVKVPLGGPPFLEVTGLALGGAYNRALVIPEVTALGKFPFIQAAMSFAHPESNEFKNPFPQVSTGLDGVIANLKALGDTAPPKVGSYWIAAGLAFTSFKVLTGFALVSVAFGKSAQISAVGELQLRLPPPQEGVDAVKPLVFIDTFLRAVLDISSGEFALDAYVKNSSYIVEKDAHLTGGFAIRIWYGSAHRGEFVVSAGGYSPGVDLASFSYYPAVPRLSMTMALGGGVQIQAKMYFAMTSSMVMYGVGFQVSGKWGPANVWATVALDELVAWDPFHYDVYVGVEVGASLRIKVWFVHITITVHVGASLHIWGPSFSGQARLDLGVCTISWHLGANASKPAPLSWSDFTAKYLTSARTAPGEPPDPQTKAVSDIQVTSTPFIVLERQNASDPRWVVDPESLVIRTRSQIPTKSWSATILGKPSSGTAQNTAFGVGPCDVADDSYHATHSVTIDGPGGVDFKISPQVDAVPAALWKQGSKTAVGPGSAIDGVIAGLELRPIHPSPDRTLPADADNLLVSTDVLHLRHLQASTDHSAGLDGQSVSGSIASVRATGNRQKLFDALKAHLQAGGMPDVDADTVDVSGFASANDADLFIDTPRKRLLGEDRA